jgi:predicted dehydrogenase
LAITKPLDAAPQDAHSRIAIVGLGLVGLRHADAIAQAHQTELAAIVDPTDVAANEAKRRGVPHFLDLQEMIDIVRPDGVILSTPTRLHVSQAKICVRAGIPTLVEKPLADDLEQASSLIDMAQKANVPLLVGHHRRHNPLIQSAKAMIDSGKIGDLRAMHATCWFYKPDAYFDQAPWRKQIGAGPISVNLVHDIDLMRHLCGEVVSVQAQSTASRRGFENEDVAAAVLRFDNGAIGTITVSDSIVSPWSWELTAKEYPIYPATQQSAYMIGGSAGALSIPDRNLWRHEDGPDWWSPISATASPVASADPLVNQIGNFAEVAQGIAKPLVSGAEGLKTLRVVDAIQCAAQSGETVQLDRSIRGGS